jgi:hypothetical protein
VRPTHLASSHRGGDMDTRAIAVAALVIAVIVLLVLVF